ncbi:RagB/SusD family nutrient uptake outer membrane protein [Christiangramia sp. SM2212]|uniref:RagB/SusD family nutrient uptake outer membrane protein n=1 Tax=Christiangramia sediminicola TaxID=3073267 RepID=A0ABU1ERY5_9FLAO|nr:RagB/SusD family nutrient uptake outer membrane protein [Christiangramia sp. SM2212]MDR5591140.1 RagB/SusD family nutrient uptake outer membrane protein [Christiangramia sp. SM2212]
MKTILDFKPILFFLIVLSFTSCEELVQIDTPNYQITSEVVFSDIETARSAVQGIYNELFNTAFSNGGTNSVTVISGLSADELKSLRPTDRSYMDFYENEIQTTNTRNLNLWSSAYKIIYMSNSLLDGISNSTGIEAVSLAELKGEAKFTRAFSYFYLVNLYGEVPLILTKDYRENALADSNTKQEIYEQIINDLQEAVELLPQSYRNQDRINVNQSVAKALLARVQLYLKNWEEAELLSTQVISQTDTYEILEDLDQVFLANSREAIWQISPAGRGGSLTQTKEGAAFIFHPFISSLTHVALTDDLVNSFDLEDQRQSKWIGFHSRSENYHAFKYKDRNSSDNLTEYSMVIRLSEMYLIRAEARLMQSNLPGAIADLDVIKARAGLPIISEFRPNMDGEELMDEVIEERRKELFTEWGHRWLDLKRTERSDAVLAPIKPDWEATDRLYPIPAEERMKNPNLNQNPGY